MHKINNFDGPLVDVQGAVRDFSELKATDIKKGTLVWCWEDDGSQLHRFRILNSYYVPSGGVATVIKFAASSSSAE